MCSMEDVCGMVWRPRRPPLLALLLLATSGVVSPKQFHRTYRASDTQLHWIDGEKAPRGFITTEGFTEPPWSRRNTTYDAVWLLQAPANHSIIAYMMQYHLADGDLRASTFSTCRNKTLGVVICNWERLMSTGDRSSGSVNVARTTNGTPTNRSTKYHATVPGDSWLVLDLNLPAGGGGGPADGCLQSTESRGFNITYEVVKLTNAKVKALARRDLCFVLACNLNGDCLASADFRRFYCGCRPGYYGEFCQYGDLCDPNNNINPCHNNGECRQRRDVAECKCPAPYHGRLCQLKYEGLLDPSYCSRFHRLQCEAGCSLDGPGSELRCACSPSYQLLANGSCSRSPALRQYIIEVTVTDSDIELSSSNIESRLGFNRTAFNESESLTVVAFEASALGGGDTRRLVLRLTAPRWNEPTLYRWFSDGVTHGKLGDVGVRPLAFSFRSEPEPTITSLTLDDGAGPPAIGSRTRLDCFVQGTDSTEVHWYKGDARINVTRASLLRGHHISQGRYQVNGEQYNHYLTVGRLVAEDEGLFRCVTADPRSSRPVRQTIRLQLPSMQLALYVNPALSSVRHGENITISCALHSSGRNRNNSILVWSKAAGREPFRPLTHLDHEQVVSFCWGRSLLIIRRPESARYECAVHMPPLSNRVTAEVVVLRPEELSCPRVQEGNITWQETAADRQDLQPCPGTDRDIHLPGWIIKVPARYARRTCERTSRVHAHWKAPDFIECVDRELFTLQKQVDQLLAGYDVISLETALKEMHQTMLQRLEAAQHRQPARLLAAEVEAFRHLLVNMSSYMVTVATDGQLKQAEEEFLGTVKPLFSPAGAAQMSDKHTAELLSAMMGFLLRRVFVPQPVDSKVDGHAERHVFILTRRLNYFGAGAHFTMPFRTHSCPRWLGMMAEISLSADQPWRSYVLSASELGLVVAVNPHTSDLYPHGYTPDDNGDELGRSGETFRLDSNLVSIGLSKRPRLLDSPFPPSVQVILTLTPYTCHLNSSQRHSCAQLTPAGRWRLDACQIGGDKHDLNCICEGLGTYALVWVTQEPSPLYSVISVLHMPVAVGCVVSLLVLLYSSAVLLRHCCRRPSVPARLQLQCSLVLAAAMVVLLLSARDTTQKGMWMAVSAASLQYLLLSAMSTQLAIKMHVFGEQVKLQSMRSEPHYFKYIVFLISTGMPLLIMAATLGVQVMHGWNQMRSWWIVYGSSFYYGVMVPMTALMLISPLLLLYVRAMLRGKDPAPEKNIWIQSRMRLMMRSFVLEFTLLAMVIISALYINFPGVECQVLLAIDCILTSVVLLFCYVVRGDPDIQWRPCANKSSADSEQDGGKAGAPATLRSRATLSMVDPSRKPLLPRCGCRPSPAVIAANVTAPVSGLDSGSGSSPSSGPGSGSGSGSAETDECAVSSTPNSSATSSSSSSDSGASQRHAPVSRQPQPAQAAARAALLQVEADVIAVDTDSFDPPPKPGREAVRVVAAARPRSRVSGARGKDQWVELAGPSRHRPVTIRPT